MDGVGRLLITADDANVNSNIDHAILELIELGVVTNVALFANTNSGSGFERCITSDTSISIHLNLTHGQPVSDTYHNATLVNKKGYFLSPKDLLESSSGDLGNAIAKYKSSVLPHINSDEIIGELRAQVEKFKAHYGKIPIYNSFHQDLDSDDRVFDLIEGCKFIPKTRQHLLESGDLSGFHYTLFDQNNSPQSYISEVEKMLSSAIKISSKSGGAPFEIALHPSTSAVGLDAFTAYRKQRVNEFDAWRSDKIASIVRSGSREGSIISFSIDAAVRT